MSRQHANSSSHALKNELGGGGGGGRVGGRWWGRRGAEEGFEDQ